MWDYASRRSTGRPSIAAAIRTLVIRIATENPAWVHRRVAFGLKGLETHPAALAEVPLFLLALPVVRGVPALLYARCGPPWAAGGLAPNLPGRE